MSGHGISPTWVQNSEFDFGDPWIFDPTVIRSIFTECEIAEDGDIDLLNTLNLICEINSGNVDVLNIFSLECDTTKNGDIQPLKTLSIIVVVVAA